MAQVSRAEREREQYNKGLQRQTYDRYLSPSKIWYYFERQNRAREIFNQYPDAQILELGSNMWWHWIEQNGISPDELTCINISEKELEIGIQDAKSATCAPTFMLMDAHQLDFEDNSFDVVFGAAILHHLDLEQSLREIQRVLKPGGVMFFAEPMDMNPVGRVVRMMTPGARTADEKPFRLGDLRMLRQHFACDFHFEGFCSVPMGAISALLKLPPRNMASKAAYRVDRLIGTLPYLQYWCRHTFVVGRHRK